MKSLFLAILLILLTSLKAESQIFQNLDFEMECDTSATGFCSWDLSWGKKYTILPYQSSEGKSLLITNTIPKAVGFTEQKGYLNKFDGIRILTLKARAKAEDVLEKGAGLNIGVYDSQNNLIFYKDMGYSNFKWIRGTKDWAEYSINSVIDKNAAYIKIGLILYGEGKVWFDDLDVSIEPITDRIANQTAEEYILAASNIIEKNSLVKDLINIDSLINTALKIAGSENNYDEFHLAVEYMIQSLRQYGDFHSFFMNPDVVSMWKNDTTVSTNIKYPEYKVIDNIGYISVPGFHGGNEKLILAFADSIQTALHKLSDENIKGWIVDLRNNDGGNMEPMIAGLGPLFDSEILGYLIDVDGNRESWRYKDGAYYWEDEMILSASNPITLSDRLPIAVLIGPRVGSSGEIVTISFIGNGMTKLFGQPTMGLTTGNGGFDLPDSARMMLASTIMADRNGNAFHGSIEPDEKISTTEKQTEDQVLQSALNWLQNLQH